MFEVFKIGTPVTIGKSIDATILEINIKDKGLVLYQCSWWNGNTYEVKWFEEFMVTGEQNFKEQIGFKK